LNKRVYIGITLVLLIAVMSVILILNWETAFTRVVKIKYADGCVEVYKNENLTTPECINGRFLLVQAEEEYNRTHQGEWQALNLTIN